MKSLLVTKLGALFGDDYSITLLSAKNGTLFELAESEETDLESPESDSERQGDKELRQDKVYYTVWLNSVILWQSSGIRSSKQLAADVTCHPTPTLQSCIIPVSAASIKFKVVQNSWNMCYIHHNYFPAS